MLFLLKSFFVFCCCIFLMIFSYIMSWIYIFFVFNCTDLWQIYTLSHIHGFWSATASQGSSRRLIILCLQLLPLGSARLTRCPIEPDLLVNDLITCWIKIYVHTNKNNTTLCMCGCTPPCDAGLRGINRRQQVDGSIYTNNRNNKNTVITIDNMFSDKSSCEGYTKTADMQTSTTTTTTN